MIQRKQTLFLLQLVFLGIALLFIPCVTIVTTGTPIPVHMVPLNAGGFHSTGWHMAAVALNFIALVLASLTVFLYKKRELQLKLTYVLMLFWLVMISIIGFCPLVAGDSTTANVSVGVLSVIIGFVALAAAYLAARYIKRDIEIIKSADRIR